MREIKFRAWLDIDGIMINNEAIHGNELCVLSGYHDEEIIIMQQIGLRDENGVEIYEGDIIKHWTTAYRNNSGVQLGRVHFHYGQYVVCDYIDDDSFNRVIKSFNSFEVVGNIYENKEIMEEHENKLKAYCKKRKEELLK